MPGKTRVVKVGKFAIGGDNPVSVQSMCNTDTRDLRATIDQIRRLEDSGCEIIRVAVPDPAAAKNLGRIRKAIGIPLVADIHFDWRLAVEAVRQGVDKIRINPGNIGEKDKVREVVKACKSAGIPIRIGVNCGSLKALKKIPAPKWSPDGHSPLKRHLHKYWPSHEWAKMMVKEALDEVRLLEREGFRDIIVSLKADDIERTVMANLLFSEKSDIPLHVGVTEAGSFLAGTVKSALGIGLLLTQGIGDTIRVSLTEDPVMQVRAAYEILKALGLRRYGPNLIACPTCGRCQVNVEKVIKEIEERVYSDKTLLTRSTGKKIAVMGCVVNGPGEARDADFGIAGGKGVGVWIERGKQMKVIKESEWVNEVIRKIRSLK